MKKVLFLSIVFYMGLIGIGHANDLRTHIEKGYTYASEGNTEAAIKEFKKASQIAPQNPDIWYSLGVLYGCPNSKNFYQKAIKLDPKYEDAYYNLGVCFEQEGKIKEARTQYQILLDIQPQNQQIQYWMGQSYLQEKDYKKAIPFLKRSLEQNPKHYVSALDLGNALESEAALSEAIKYYLIAISIEPDLPPAYINIATPLMAQGKRLEAFKYLERGADLAIKTKDAQLMQAALMNLKADFPESTMIEKLTLNLKQQLKIR